VDRGVTRPVKPAPFEYVAPATIAEAAQVLAADDGAKVIAGGQSLMPLLSLRLARPSVLVDINGLGLDGVAVDRDAGVVRVGALVRQRRLELDPAVARAAPLLAEAARLIGYPAIRNQGTIGGSLAHADPAAELPAVLTALGGSVAVTGAGGERVVAAEELFDGFLTTTLAPDEVITEVLLPVPGDRTCGAAFCEWAPRTGDFAEAGVGVAVAVDGDGVCTWVGAAACGVGTAPVELGRIIGPAGVVGASRPGDTLLRGVTDAVSSACAGAGGDRAELAGLLAARAVFRAFARLCDEVGEGGGERWPPGRACPPAPPADGGAAG
jgi:carbon-monoxide dehydrogenase medium subunit